jgi:hypothetical protein
VFPDRLIICNPYFLASSTTKTGRHDIAEILLKVALNTINQIKSKDILIYNAGIVAFS